MYKIIEFFKKMCFFLLLAVVVFIVAHGVSSCGEWGRLFVAVCGLLLVVELVAAHRLRHTGSVAAACGL